MQVAPAGIVSVPDASCASTANELAVVLFVPLISSTHFSPLAAVMLDVANADDNAVAETMV